MHTRCSRWAASIIGAALGVACGGGGDVGADAADTASDDAEPSGADAASGDGAWSSAAEVASGPVQEFGVAALDGKLYVIGGIGGSQILDRVSVYDASTDTWEEGPSLPAPAHHPNVAALDGSIYVLGSLEGSGFNAQAAVWRWTPGDGEWVEHGSMPQPRGGAAVGVVGDWIYVAGGYSGSAVTTFSAYHPGDDEWNTDLPPLPEPRDHLVGAALDDVFFAVGGRDTSIANLNGRVDAFDPETGEWESRAPMLTARAGGAGGVVGGEIVVVGGEGNPEAGSGGVFAEAEAYDPASDSWRPLPDMPTPRHGMQAAGIGDSLYVPGGAARQGLSGTTAIHEVLTP